MSAPESLREDIRKFEQIGTHPIALRGAITEDADDPEQSCGLGAVSIDGVDAGNLTNFLEKRYRIHVRPRFVAGEFSCIRVTPNVFTTLEEVDTFASAIEHVVRHGMG